MTKFLTLKHWQLLGLLILIPLISQIILILFMNGTKTAILLELYPISTIIFIVLFSFWLYSIVTNLYKKLPATVTIPLSIFKIILVLPFVFTLFKYIHIYLFSNISDVLQIDSEVDVLDLLSLFCILYCLYISAKALKTFERQTPMPFGDFVGDFFLILFFPIGIWIIQPRLNKLFDKDMIDVNIIDSNLQ
jgi:hypothetical protein